MIPQFRLRLLLWICLGAITAPCHAQTAPAAPTNGTAIAAGNGAMTLGWRDNSTNEDGFAIFNYNGTAVGSLVKTAAANATATTISGLTAGTSYRFAVFAYRLKTGTSTGEAVFSATGVVTPSTRVADYLQRAAWQGRQGEALDITLSPTNPAKVTASTVSGPTWLAYDPTTRTLTGTPATAGIVAIQVTITYVDGFVLHQNAVVRVLPAVSGPVARQTQLPSLSLSLGEQSFALSGYFDDPDTSMGMRVDTTMGHFNLVLYPQITPASVTNFKAYAGNAAGGRYDGSIFHRSVSGFVIQGGGYLPAGGNDFTKVTADPPVANEPGLTNIRGTIAMAKQGGNPDSASCEWFVNLGDNAANLDNQNGGFSVFGRIAGNGMTVVDQIAALPKGNYTAATVGGIAAGDLLGDCPVNAATAPAEIDPSILVRIERAREVPVLAYEILDAGDPAVAVPTLDNGNLKVLPVAAGTSSVRLRVTDLDGNSIDQDIGVSVPAMHTLTAATTPHGRITGIGNGGSYTDGSTVELTAIPDSGYVFANWTGDASGSTNPLVVTMTTNKQVGAIFREDLADSDGNGFKNFEEAMIGPFPGGIRIGDRYQLNLSPLKMETATAMIVTGLPAGLAFNPTTRTISGVTSGKVGIYKAVIRLMKGSTVVRSIPLTISVAAFPTSLLGGYDALLETGDDGARLPAGLCRISVTAGLWTGTLQLPGQAMKSSRGVCVLESGRVESHVSLVFPATPATTAVPAFPGATISLTLVGSSQLVSGSFVAGTTTGSARGFRLAKGAALPEFSRNLTMVMEPTVDGDGTTLPGGIGWANGTVSTNGTIALTGQLGDAQKITVSTGLSASGQAILWVQPYKHKASYIGGVVTIGNLGQTTRSISTETTSQGMHWYRAADSTEPGYPDGFAPQALTARTSRWINLPDAESIALSLGLDDAWTLATTFIADATPNLPTGFTLTDNFSLIPIPGSSLPWKGSVARKGGTFSGTLTYQSAPPLITGSASGVFLQDESFGLDVGAGLVKVPISSGTKIPRFRTAGVRLTQ